ncbi:hypothetical protein ACFE04_017262 [Oxalis oulophora]
MRCVAMKRTSFGLKGKEISLLLIVLVCGSILIWTWDRSPLLTAFLPPTTRLHLPPDIQTDVSISLTSDLSTSVGEDVSALSQRESTNNQEEQTSNIANLAEPEKGFSSYITDPIQNKDEEDANGRKFPKVQENHDTESSANMPEVKSEQFFEPEDSKQEEQNDDTGAECNLAKGKWVVDKNRPLYSGFACKQWLSSMWACRLMQREDFDFEQLRWQPKDCEMDQFERSKFFKRMQDKTLAFVGDSLGRQQFQSLMCMITGGEDMNDILDVGEQFGLITPAGGIRPNGWAYWFPSTNTTVLYYWSATLCGIEPINITDPRTDYAMHLDRPPQFLTQYLHKINVLVLNTGHHWNRGKFRGNRWVMYVNGAPNVNKKLIQIGDAKNFAIHNIVKWVDSQLPKYPNLKAFYRSISPRHFVNGDWNTGGSCNNTRPMSIGKEVLQDESSDFSAGSAVKGMGVKLLDITALSQVRDEGHISRFSLTAAPGVQDCLHWCLPGVPDTWNEILVAQI